MFKANLLKTWFAVALSNPSKTLSMRYKSAFLYTALKQNKNIVAIQKNLLKQFTNLANEILIFCTIVRGEPSQFTIVTSPHCKVPNSFTNPHAWRILLYRFLFSSRPNRMFCRTVPLNIQGYWHAKLILPWPKIEPDVFWSSPTMDNSNAVLPLPFGPVTATCCPFSTLKLMLHNAGTASPSYMYKVINLNNHSTNNYWSYSTLAHADEYCSTDTTILFGRVECLVKGELCPSSNDFSLRHNISLNE